MTNQETRQIRLSDADVAEVMRLLRGVDSVELKTTVPVDAHRATIQGLPLDPVEAQPRQVFFFDTPDLTLDAAGVVVRARRIQGGRAEAFQVASEMRAYLIDRGIPVVAGQQTKTRAAMAFFQAAAATGGRG
ncbi:MAG TPA: hypothetical protein VJZ50_05930 [Candidatus Limnocylindrales bacterium]|nr:hypothetical protein [Candidatus Limnocylindrales bacterium]